MSKDKTPAVFGFHVEAKRFKAYTKLLAAGNPVKDAKIEAIDYANDCFGKYEADKNSGNLENAFKAVSYLPANLTFAPQGLFHVAKDQKLLHSVIAKEQKEVTIQSNRVKADNFSLDLNAIAEWREWAISKVVAVHAPKAKAEFNKSGYVKTLRVNCDEIPGLEELVIDALSVEKVVALYEERGFTITYPELQEATG